MKNVFKPILFSTSMVEEIIAGNKTATRREVKFPLKSKTHHLSIGECDIAPPVEFSPYEINQILWVRETWLEYKSYQRNMVEVVNHYKAGHSKLIDPFLKSQGKKWTPSIHMPKKAARLFLKVKNVRVERLQSISEKDAINEGCSEYGPFGEFKGSIHPNGGGMRYRAYSKASRAFQCIWETINGVESWKRNPWVWVIEFENIDKPEDFI